MPAVIGRELITVFRLKVMRKAVRFFVIGSIIASFSSVFVWRTGHDSNRHSTSKTVARSAGQSRRASDVDATADSATASQQLRPESDVPFHPFLSAQPKAVVILTYQRSGSTFLGQLFNTNPDAFYIYEPLDSLYTAMYGTNYGWNVPTDITNFWNGSERVLPVNEVKAVSSFLINMFTCSIDMWPTETLVHPYWLMSRGSPRNGGGYARCLRRLGRPVDGRCHAHTVGFCGNRFGRLPGREAVCRLLLTDRAYRDSFRHVDVRRQFEMFSNCSNAVRLRVEGKCIRLLKASCGGRKLRAVKTVRATMESMVEVLETLPNARIIHLIRDPRGVVLSRKLFHGSGSGHFSNQRGVDKLLAEARLHCRTLARDIGVKEQLDVKFPGRIYTIVYEDVVRDLLAAARKIYSFIDEPVHDKTLEWIRSNGGNTTSTNGTYIANKWKQAMTAGESEEIVRLCSKVFARLRSTNVQLPAP